MFHVHATYLITDSTIVLAQLQRPGGAFNLFTGSRIDTIQTWSQESHGGGRRDIQTQQTYSQEARPHWRTWRHHSGWMAATLASRWASGLSREQAIQTIQTIQTRRQSELQAGKDHRVAHDGHGGRPKPVHGRPPVDWDARRIWKHTRTGFQLEVMHSASESMGVSRAQMSSRAQDQVSTWWNKFFPAHSSSADTVGPHQRRHNSNNSTVRGGEDRRRELRSGTFCRLSTPHVASNPSLHVTIGQAFDQGCSQPLEPQPRRKGRRRTPCWAVPCSWRYHSTHGST